MEKIPGTRDILLLKRNTTTQLHFEIAFGRDACMQPKMDKQMVCETETNYRVCTLARTQPAVLMYKIKYRSLINS
jgi:hypothetical protein